MRRRSPNSAIGASKRVRSFQTINRVKGTVALAVAVILCISLLSFLSSVPVKAAPGDIVRASTSSSGEEGNGYSNDPSISADGRYVAFRSNASSLMPGGNTGDAIDVLRKDNLTGDIVIASTSIGGEQGNNWSGYPSISANGRYVAFNSNASNLVAEDTNATRDVFRKDLSTGEIVRASVSSTGEQGDNESEFSDISADGRYVAFRSAASNLVPGDTNSSDVFRKDLSTGELVCASTSLTGELGNYGSLEPSISADGRYVAFYSGATNLVDGDTNSTTDVFRKDLSTGDIVRASTSSTGVQGDFSSYQVAISADGMYVAFSSRATNLVGGDTNGSYHIYRKDLSTGGIVRASSSSTGEQGNGDKSDLPSISAHGRHVAFSSSATNLVEGDTNGCYDVFRKDLSTGDIVRASTSASGGQCDYSGWLPSDTSISADGQYVAFESESTNLVYADTNGKTDIFRKDLVAGSGGPFTINIDSSDEFEGSADYVGGNNYNLNIDNRREMWFSLNSWSSAGLPVWPSSLFARYGLVPPSKRASYTADFPSENKEVHFTENWNDYLFAYMGFLQAFTYLLPLDIVALMEAQNSGDLLGCVSEMLAISPIWDFITSYGKVLDLFFQGEYRQAIMESVDMTDALFELGKDDLNTKKFADILSKLCGKKIPKSQVASSLGNYITLGKAVYYLCNVVYEAVFIAASGIDPYVKYKSVAWGKSAAAARLAGGAGSTAVSSPELKPPSGSTIGSTVNLTANVPKGEVVKHVDFEYSTNGTDWSVIGSSEAGTCGKLMFLVPFDTYSIAEPSVQVRARSFDFSEGPGPYASATYTLDHEAPAAPTGLVATGTTDSVTLTWDANGEPDLCGYNVYRSTSPGGTYTLLDCTVLGLSEDPTSYRDMEAHTGGPYYYKVSAFDQSNNEGSASGEATATPAAGGEAPTNLDFLPAEAITIADSASLIGSARDDGAVTSFSFEYSTNGSDWNPIGSTSDITYDQDEQGFSGMLSWNASAVPEGGIDIRMTATDKGGNSSTTTHSIYKNTTPPDVPNGLTASYSAGNVNLQWDGAAGASSYVLVKRDESTDLYQTLGFSEANSYTDTDLTKGKTYYYKAASVNEYGTRSGFSGEVPLTVPNTPSITFITPTSGPVGTTVTINGTDFGTTHGSSYVTFNGKKATSYSKWTTSQIKVKVPSGATTGLVKVTTPGGTSNGKKFTVTEPEREASSSSTWYLAEGTSDWGFETYVTIQNPNDKAVTAQVTYMTGAGAKKVPDIKLPPESQTVLNPRDDIGVTDFSTKVSCKEGKTICVDRRMVWTGPGAASQEGHSSVGVTSPAKTWYLPEGSSKWGFETWLLIQNPGTKDASVTVTYMIEGEAPVTKTKTVKASSRSSFNMETDIGQKDASIKVESNTPVIPERAMYRNSRREGHDSIGTTTPAKDYYLAEGTTGYGFTTYVLIQNPNNVPTDVDMTYMTGAGPVNVPTFQMPAQSRKTINVNATATLPDPNFSTKVHGSQPIIAERAMYWGAASLSGEACHDSIGMEAPHTTFYLPDGQTGNGYETYTLVQNPNGSEVQVGIYYLVPGGSSATNQYFTDSIPANSRKTFNMDDKLDNTRAAILVTSLTSGKKIMVERAMYWNSRGAGTDTIGGYSD